MKTLILGTAAVVALGLTPAYAEDHGHAADAAVKTHAANAAPAAHTEAQVETHAETAVKTEAAVEAQNIAKAVAANAELSTLMAALDAAELTEALNGAGPFTIFAPTNAAFEKLGKDKVADLMKPENKEQLIAVLKYHVVPGKIAAVDAKGATVDLTTLNGAVVKVDGKGEVVKVGEASVTKTDIIASNGVVHEIDTVIMPPVTETKVQH